MSITKIGIPSGGTTNQVLVKSSSTDYDVEWGTGGGGGGGVPGGSNTQVQFNDGGSFGGDAGFTYNKTTNRVTLGSLVLNDVVDPGVDTDKFLVLTSLGVVSYRNGASLLVDIGGVPTSRSLTINGTAYDLSANRSWSVGTVTSVATSAPITGGTITGSGTIGITQASGSTDGYLSSTDWNTFNNKQNTLTNAITGTGTATSGQVAFFSGSTSLNNSNNLFWNNTDARLGIGTISATDTLDVNGTAKIRTITQASVALPKFLVATSAGVIQYRSASEILSDIGASSTSDVVTLSTAQSIAGEKTFNSVIKSDLGVDTLDSQGITWRASSYGVANARINFTNTSGMALYSDGTVTPTMFLTDDGNRRVGIGLTTPAEKLHILQGNIFVDNANGSVIIRNQDATNQQQIRMRMSGNNGILDVTRNSGTAPNLIFGTEATEQMRITSGGNVGIGTNNPGFKIQISGSISTAAGIENVARIDGGLTVASGGINFLSYSTDYVRIAGLESRDRDNNVRSLTINPSGGNLLVGTTTDSGEKFQVNGTAKIIGATTIDGKITAGSANSTNGSEILSGKYTSGALTVFGTEYSTGAPVLGYAVKPSTTASGAFLSATGVNIDRGAYTVSGSIHKWYSGTTQTVAENSSVTMTERMSLLDNGKLKLNGYTSASSYTGSAQGLLGFANDGSIITLDDRVSGSGSTNQVAFFDGTKTIKSESAFVWDQTNDRLGISSTASFGKVSVGSGTGFVGFNVGTSSSPERGNIFFDTDGTGWKMNIGKYQSSTFSSIMTVHDSSNVSIGSASDNGNRLQVSGKISVNTSGQAQAISTRYGANSDGYNTWIGGGGDSAIGSVADTTKGSYNCSYGWYSLGFLNTGAYNNGFGVNTLGSLESGFGNSAFGTSSSVTMSTGYGNSAYGNNSLEKGTTCYYNVALGNASLYNITTGYQNVGVGFEAGRYITAGTANQTSTNSVYIGTDARAGSNGNDNEIVIGATSRGNGTNSVTLGNTSITKTVLQGSVCIGNTSTSYKLEVTGDAKVTTGALGVNVNPNATDGRIDASNDIVAYSSDRRLKENIKEIESPIEKVQKLKGFTYNWNDLANQLAGYNTSESLVGVFAQDVQEVLPEAVKLAPFDNNGHNKSISGEDYLTVQYEKLVPLLIEAIKDLQNQINELKK